MFKKILVILISALIISCMFVSVFATETADITDGTIDSAEDMLLLMTTSSAWSGSYTLTKDIDMSGVSGQTPIGDGTDNFTGTFDGGGYTVSNLNISTTAQYTGLFGYIKGATVKNLTVDGLISSSAQYIGGLVGYANASTIENCQNKATVSGTRYVGGMVGYCNNGISLTNCYSSGDVISSASDVGGLVGLINGITDMSYCWSDGKVTYNNQCIGGMIGRTAGTIKVTNCYADSTLALADGSSYAYDSARVRAFCGWPAAKNFTACYFGSATAEGNSCTGIVAYTDDAFETLDGGSGKWVLGNNGPELKTFHVCDDPDKNGKCACGADFGQEPEHTCTAATYTDNGDGTHTVKCDCGETINAAEAHDLAEIGLCTKCEFKEAFDGEIGTALEFIRFMYDSSLWSGTYILTANINLADYTGTLAHKPIGDSTNLFTGTFDGDNFEITGLNIDVTTDGVGLFGRLGEGAVIQNLTVCGSVKSTGNYVGGIVGLVSKCNVTIQNCHNKADVTGNQYVGGVVGYLYGNDTSDTEKTVLASCYNSGTVTATSSTQADVGGVAGIIWNACGIRNCLATGTVSYNAQYAGGIFGRTVGAISISNCYSNAVLELASNSSFEYNSATVRAFCGYPAAKNFIACYFGSASAEGNTCDGIREYNALDFEKLNIENAWVDLATPELKIFHSTDNCDNTRGHYIALEGENEGYHAPICSCGSENSIDIANKAEHTYSLENGLCTACGEKAPFDCVWNGHKYLAKADGVYCTDCGEKVDTPTANEDIPLVLSLDTANATAGGIVTLTLSANTAGGGFWGTRFTVTAPEGFTLTSVDDSLLADTGYFYTDGTYMIVSKLGDGTTGTEDGLLTNGYLNGEVLNLTYSVSDTVVEGNYSFILTLCETADASENYLATATVSAEVSVKEAIKGDFNNDGIVNIADVLVVIKAVLNDTPLENGDLNGDNKVSLIDVLRVMKLIVK
ncbi:MAG: hypothetical protein IJ002_08995 [Clostridia bacterium]|nr:hypothetical protein [Clostridia bacterium]